MILSTSIRPGPARPLSAQFHAQLAPPPSVRVALQPMADAGPAPWGTARVPGIPAWPAVQGLSTTAGAALPLSRPDSRQRQEAVIPRVTHQLYAHGAYMGLAKSLLTDPMGLAMLQQLMPGVATQATALLAVGQISALMLLLENNPVLAAYGAARRGRPLPMEWDVWLDPEQPEDLDRARIIHGNLVATLLSAQYSRISPRMLVESVRGSNAHAGISPRAWLDLYAQAAEALGLAARRPCALYLDIKSGWSSAQDVQRFVDEVRRHGLAVRGVGSFTAAQLGGVRVAQPLLYLHGVTGVALAQRAGALPAGGRALLNGGALLQHAGKSWRVMPAALRELRRLQEKGGLQLGLYVQENLVCPEALSVLTDMVNQETELFALGFAYGNLPGVAEGGLHGGAGLGWQRISMVGDAVRRWWPGRRARAA